MATLQQHEFEKLRVLIYDKFGINLSDEKYTLVESRLSKTLVDRNLKDFSEFYEWVVGDSTKQGLSLLIDKISTNHTFFYRETEHYHFLTKNIRLLEQIASQEPDNELRIWSAGCSYGDEPYTYAMILKDLIEKTGSKLKFKILATDINLDAITNAKEGIYNSARLSELPKVLQKKYVRNIGTDMYQISSEIKKHIIFRRLNFMNKTFPFKNKFHLISCRNVMIYFDNQTKDDLLFKFYRHIADNGFLFIGHSESITKTCQYFKIVQPAIFEPVLDTQ